MNADFHYYATYCAAILAGFPHEESAEIAYSARMVDHCSRTYLSIINAPLNAATTQLQLELMDARTDLVGLQDITRIWASFHFLPGDLNAEPPKRSGKRYKNKYRLICKPDSELLEHTVELAKNKPVQAVGVAMHVLADTWAHMYFAGTPSMVINNTNSYFYELIPEGDGYKEIKINFRHSASLPDEPERHIYTNSLNPQTEKNIMVLGHGRAGHLPDYCFIRYKYLPAWGEYEEIVKDNPSDYLHAFSQMIAAMKYLRGVNSGFRRGQYDMQAIEPCREELDRILNKRQLDASADWKAMGERLSGKQIPDFDLDRYNDEYIKAADKEKTFLGRFIAAALAQKSMVTHHIYQSGNKLAGYSIDQRGRKLGLKSKSSDGGEAHE